MIGFQGIIRAHPRSQSEWNESVGVSTTKGTAAHSVPHVSSYLRASNKGYSEIQVDM
jgi:hypothetical protein